MNSTITLRCGVRCENRVHSFLVSLQISLINFLPKIFIHGSLSSTCFISHTFLTPNKLLELSMSGTLLFFTTDMYSSLIRSSSSKHTTHQNDFKIFQSNLSSMFSSNPLNFLLCQVWSFCTYSLDSKTPKKRPFFASVYSNPEYLLYTSK